jgi:hypothetical protein
MLTSKAGIVFIAFTIAFGACTAQEQQIDQALSDELLSEQDEQDEQAVDLKQYIDEQDFKNKVGVSFDEWKNQLEAMDEQDLQAIYEENDFEDVEDMLSKDGQRKLLFIKKAVSFVKKGVDTVKKHVVEPVKQVVTKGLSYFKEKAKEIAMGMLKKILAKMQWTPAQYWAFMMRHPKDFTGTQVDTNDDYTAFHNHGDAATQAAVKFAFGHMHHQDKCDIKRSGWREYHPTPFAEIAKNPKGPFSVYPFKAQFENDPTGYFLEPCNAISNGFFLSIFNYPELRSKSACSRGSSKDPFAMQCIDEDHLLQIVTAGMPFGSWFMHGDGGSPLGGFLDTRGMFVQFYYMYRLVLKAFVHDVNARKKLTLTHGCNAKNVPDQTCDKHGCIKWVDSNGERNCHLYWARQFKKLLTNATLIQDRENTAFAASLVKGLPDMAESIAAIVFVSLRAVFHKEFPAGQKIFETISSKMVDALMAKAPEPVKQAQKAFAAALSPDAVLGFENPHDGLVHVLAILADFMDAMFFQESGQFGPGTKGLLRDIQPNVGCTLMPHATWHRKATRVIGNFIKMGKSLNTKLKHPSKMTKFRICGAGFCGIYPNLAKGLSSLIASVTAAFNMKTLAGWDFTTKPDILNVPGFVAAITKQFGKGWPAGGNFAGGKDKWPKCSCKKSEKLKKGKASASSGTASFGKAWTPAKKSKGEWIQIVAEQKSILVMGVNVEDAEEQVERRRLLSEETGEALSDASDDVEEYLEGTDNWGGVKKIVHRHHKHHRHNPHRHHSHNPHSHNPHSHNPHSHNPHSHNPHSHSTAGPTKYKVVTSFTGTVWTPVDGGKVFSGNVRFATPVMAKYVRIVVESFSTKRSISASVMEGKSCEKSTGKGSGLTEWGNNIKKKMKTTKAAVKVTKVTKAPVSPTKAPVKRTKAPVKRTKAPVKRTDATVKRTKAPVKRTKAPVKRTKRTKAPITPTKVKDAATKHSLAAVKAATNAQKAADAAKKAATEATAIASRLKKLGE